MRTKIKKISVQRLVHAVFHSIIIQYLLFYSLIYFHPDIPLPHIGNSCRGDFICKGTASGRLSSTATLTVPESSRQPSANRRLTASHRLIAGHSRTSLLLLLHSEVGYSASFRPLFTCLVVLFSLSILHKNQSRREAERASRMGK